MLCLVGIEDLVHMALPIAYPDMQDNRAGSADGGEDNADDTHRGAATCEESVPDQQRTDGNAGIRRL